MGISIIVIRKKGRKIWSEAISSVSDSVSLIYFNCFRTCFLIPNIPKYKMSIVKVMFCLLSMKKIEYLLIVYWRVHELWKINSGSDYQLFICKMRITTTKMNFVSNKWMLFNFLKKNHIVFSKIPFDFISGCM